MLGQREDEMRTCKPENVRYVVTKYTIAGLVQLAEHKTFIAGLNSGSRLHKLFGDLDLLDLRAGKIVWHWH